MNRKLILGIVMLAIIMGSASAATPAVITASVEKGIGWLVTQQNVDGSWGSNYQIGHTSFAVLKLEDYAYEMGKTPFSDDYIYHENVIKGLNYLFLNLNNMTLLDPDVNNNDRAIFSPANQNHANYLTSIPLMAISASKTPSRLISVGPYNGETYENVAKDMVDYLVYAQVLNGNGKGGWYYSAFDRSGSSADNSNAGYATLGLGYANTLFGIATPASTITNLDNWIKYIQCDSTDAGYVAEEDGGSGYGNSCDWVNELKTGNLLYQLKMKNYPIGDARVTRAIDYVERHWNDADFDTGWKGNALTSDYQGTYTMLKGLDAYGISTLTVDGNPVDWFDVVSTELVNEQKPDGHWEGCPQFVWENGGNVVTNNILCTSWALMTIEKAVVGPKPQCSDEVDNDGDGFIDFNPPPGKQKDPGCSSPEDDSELDSGPGIPEFPSVALPILSVIGIMFLLHRKKK